MVRIPTNGPPIHPGEMLLEEFLKPLGMSQVGLAEKIGVSYPRINELVRGKPGLPQIRHSAWKNSWEWKHNFGSIFSWPGIFIIQLIQPLLKKPAKFSAGLRSRQPEVHNLRQSGSAELGLVWNSGYTIEWH